jgi:hypothetical protein
MSEGRIPKMDDEQLSLLLDAEARVFGLKGGRDVYADEKLDAIKQEWYKLMEGVDKLTLARERDFHVHPAGNNRLPRDVAVITLEDAREKVKLYEDAVSEMYTEREIRKFLREHLGISVFDIQKALDILKEWKNV